MSVNHKLCSFLSSKEDLQLQRTKSIISTNTLKKRFRLCAAMCKDYIFLWYTDFPVIF